MTNKINLADFLLVIFLLAVNAALAIAAQSDPAALQWIAVKDERLRWLNVADWEVRGDGLQPVRVAKDWRDKWPARTASRAQAAARQNQSIIRIAPVGFYLTLSLFSFSRDGSLTNLAASDALQPNSTWPRMRDPAATVRVAALRSPVN